MVLEWETVTPLMRAPHLRHRLFSSIPLLTLQDQKRFCRSFIKDTPSKSARLSKSRNSFRFGKTKSASVTRASGTPGKTVQVRGHTSVEELERKQGEVLRLLEFYEDAVHKNIPDYLVGLATMVLENVISLSRDLDQMVPNSNSSEVASLMSHMNQSVAELVLWNDQFHLYGDSSHNNQSINVIVNNVRQAVKSLVEFAINKENQNVSNSNFFHSTGNKQNESNNSLCSEDALHARKKLNGSRNSHIHGSMPEIPSGSNAYGSPNVCAKNEILSTANKLSHSISSDSILDNKDNVNSTAPPPPPKPPISVVDCTGSSSCDESAPPIPPKKSMRHSRSPLCTSVSELESPLRQSSPVNSSLNESIINDFPRRSTGSITPCSSPRSLEQVSPATSHDSMNHSLNSLGSFEASPLVNDLTSLLSQNSGISPIRHLADNSFSSLESHMYQSPFVTSGDSSSNFGCSMTSNKSYFSRQTVHTFNENKLTSLSDSTKGTVASSTTQVTSHSRSSQQYMVIHRSSRSSTCSSSSRSSGSEAENNTVSVAVPPPVPKKMRHQQGSRSSERIISHYDNTDGGLHPEATEFRRESECSGKQDLSRVQGMSSILYSASSSSTSGLGSSKSSMTSCDSSASSNAAGSSVVQRRYQKTYTKETTSSMNTTEKPPLPLKQKHIMEYMQPFKDYQMPEKEWFQHRRSHQMMTSHQLYSINHLCDDFKELLDLDAITPNPRLSLPTTNRLTPPALPPKRKARSSEQHQQSCIQNNQYETFSNHQTCVPNIPYECSCQSPKDALLQSHHIIPSSISREVVHEISEVPNCATTPTHPASSGAKDIVSEEIRLRHDPTIEERRQSQESAEERQSQDTLPELDEVEEKSLLDLLNVNEHIIFKDGTEDSDVKSGSIDALVVYATYSKNGSYLEAFLTTYRTFLSPGDLISKLFYRYYKFICSPSSEHQKAAKNAFSLLVRVVHDLVVPELTETLLKDLAGFEYNLLAKGDLKLALYFRKKLSEKLQLRKREREQSEFSVHYVTIRDPHQYTFLDFKSQDLADQMTLLDSELFGKVGIPELLHYSRDQNEEQCPNLKVFAMQINNMSSWVKTLILKSSTQDREKYYKKFIKIMKHLRKVNNNFNSCLAILSGLESAAVCRLEWPKTSTDVLKEYCDLFDFEGSYRAYRQALAETKPPCIPHLGIILQDLTKLYNVNPNFTNGKVNFLKRWLQFNILEDMKRFIPSKYDIRKNEPILNFINNFEDCMSESDLWELSLSIKPQAKSK